MSNELGEFLKSRRARVVPEGVGPGHRRVSGLRREEVAQRASISVDYYARLEQGRRTASREVLSSVAAALNLGESERSYLFELSGYGAEKETAAGGLQVSPALRGILAELESPAMVLGQRMDVLAWNPAAADLLVDFAEVPESERNYLRIFFTDERVRALHRDWRDEARAAVAMLRLEAGRRPGDPRMDALVRELSELNPDFRRWWADYDIAPRNSGRKRLRHPRLGDIEVTWEALTSTVDPDQQLIVWGF